MSNQTLFISRLEEATKLIHKDTKKCIECQAGCCNISLFQCSINYAENVLCV